MLVPMAVLFSVVLAVEETVDVHVGPEGETVRTVTTETGLSPWIPVTALLLVLPAIAGAWWWSGRAVRPLSDITALADDIQQGSLDRRIRLTGAATEVQALGDGFDRMLDRLAEASANQRRLIEDTGHALRTPLAALAANAEVVLAHPDTTLDEYRAAALRERRQVERLRRTVEDLLADARARESVTGQVDNDLVAIVARVVDQQRAATPGATLDVVAPGRLRLGVDGPSVERALTALVENAVRHSPPGRPVRVDVIAAEEGTLLSVTDEGPGIDPAERESVFERYHHRAGGTGIGLAIVRQVAQAYGGVRLTSPLGPEGGTRFTLLLPAPMERRTRMVDTETGRGSS